jgi:Tfp pilus assembly protein PilP
MRVPMLILLIVALAALVLPPDVALAQPAPAQASPAVPGPAAPPSTQPPAAVPPAAAPPAAEPYSYQALGRRDPFVSVLGMGGEPRLASKHGEGTGGMLTADISVRGTMQSGGVFIALIQGPDNRTYIVRAGDKLMDGTVKTVTAQGLIVMQDVHDPLSLVKTREIRNLLRSPEDAKQ